MRDSGQKKTDAKQNGLRKITDQEGNDWAEFEDDGSDEIVELETQLKYEKSVYKSNLTINPSKGS